MDDLKKVAKTIKGKFRTESGPINSRPSFTLFQDWNQRAKESARKANLSVNTSSAFERDSTSVANGDLQVLPLNLFNPDDPEQMSTLKSAVGNLPALVVYYLREYVFKEVMKNHTENLTASGLELGGRMLFGSRLCFTGTPSDLLPTALGKCKYESGSEAKVIRALSNPKVVSYEFVPHWTVETLLLKVAKNPHRQFRAFIDAGALITGMGNEEGLIRPFCSYYPASHSYACIFSRWIFT